MESLLDHTWTKGWAADDYELGRRAHPGQQLAFVHIPKTGMTSLLSMLNKKNPDFEIPAITSKII